MASVPTAGNLQAYRIIVVDDAKQRAQLCAACLNQSQVQEAPVCLVFLAAPKDSAVRYRSRGEYLYCIQDAANACMMTSLLCAENGLGSCWVGAFKDPQVLEVFF